MKVKKAQQDGISESEFNTTTEQDYSKLKHDALLLEYCPKVFAIIRASDDIPENEFEQ